MCKYVYIYVCIYVRRYGCVEECGSTYENTDARMNVSDTMIAGVYTDESETGSFGELTA